MAAAGTHTELVLAGLLFSVAVLVTAARVLDVPYPIFLGLGLIPGIPHIELEPGLVLLIFLPPLLYATSFFTGCASCARTSARSACSRSGSCSPPRAPSRSSPTR
jgi:NhaP-type Na+/H+ or K+/H+ antiporter